VGMKLTDNVLRECVRDRRAWRAEGIAFVPTRQAEMRALTLSMKMRVAAISGRPTRSVVQRALYPLRAAVRLEKHQRRRPRDGAVGLFALRELVATGSHR